MVPPRVGLDHACGRAGSSPGASLIICSRNRPQLLLDAVESVLEGEQVPSEIILIDQSDVPNPALKQKQEFRGCWIRYHWTDSRGVSVARNAGAMAAQHDVLVFMDDDMIAPFDWFGTLVLALIRLGHRGVVTGQVAPAAAGGFAPSTKVDPTPALYEGRTGTDILYTGNMALYRATFIEAGGFDERLGPGTAFPAAEDNDLGFRLLEAGYRIAYVPEAVVYHQVWRTRRDYLALRGRYGRGQGAFYAKHLGLKDRYMLRRIVKDLALGMRGLPKSIVFQPYGAAGELAYMVGLIIGAAAWLWAGRRSRPATIEGQGTEARNR
jgi:GT2 family glycosyltransferase